MELGDFFRKYKKPAVALSGGADSVYLMHAAAACGAAVTAIYVKTVFQPEFEMRDAERAASEAGVPLEVIEADILSDPAVASNPEDRCYFCKKKIFSLITDRARVLGCDVVVDGTNASDDLSDRPGARALAELGVRSPLRECGLTKTDIRALSAEAGLFTAEKPSYACLATRIPHGTLITEEKLQAVEKAEDALRGLGFRDFRVRMRGGSAVIQVTEDQIGEAFSRRGEILEAAGSYFDEVALDLAPRTSGD
jgi:uncharacterized protein